MAAILAAACGPVTVSEGLGRYRESVERTLERDAAEEAGREPASELRLPRRRSRRLAVGDQRLGPFEFLGLVGCSLSELVAARNGSLGRVLEPTRRLAHELEVLAAGQDCLPTLSEDRAARLRERLALKRAELGAHVWNAVWLDGELERFLGDGMRSLVGGRDASDAAWQLSLAADVLRRRPPEALDVAALEASLAELRDDPGMGPVLRALDGARRELSRVARAVAPLAEGPCSREGRRLAAVFRERYVPIQPKLAALDRRARDLLASLDALYRASAAWVDDPPEPMRVYAASVLDVEGREGLWQRYRGALRMHAEAWSGLLERCGLGIEAGT